MIARLIRHSSFGFDSSFPSTRSARSGPELVEGWFPHSSFLHLVVRVIRHRMRLIDRIEFFRRGRPLRRAFETIDANDSPVWASADRNHLIRSAVHKIEHVK